MPLTPRFERLALIGCGLIGTSFALAMKRAGMVSAVAAFDPEAKHLRDAHRLGAVDAACASASEAASNADLVFLAAPPEALPALLKELAAEKLTAARLLMDCASVKVPLLRSLSARPIARAAWLPRFVPSHPMAGSHFSGPLKARADLFENCITLLSPQPRQTPSTHKLAGQIWQRLGAEVFAVPAREHDAAMAALSHAPHLLAFAFMRAFLQQRSAQDWLRWQGPGFRDFTRIAAANPALWRQILLGNRRELLAQSKRFEASLGRFKKALLAGNGADLQRLIAQAAFP